jgi:hypothetical protein
MTPRSFPPASCITFFCIHINLHNSLARRAVAENGVLKFSEFLQKNSVCFQDTFSMRETVYIYSLYVSSSIVFDICIYWCFPVIGTLLLTNIVVNDLNFKCLETDQMFHV